MAPVEEVEYLVFDIESISDPDLVNRIKYPEEKLEDKMALDRYRDELMEKKGSDFIPYTFQLPISLVLAKVRTDFSLIDIRVLDGGPEKICRNFWNGWSIYRKPTLVTFNGRCFDMPLLELMAFRYGVPIPDWFVSGLRSYEQPRYRFNLNNHFDLCDYLTNSGATFFTGGLNLAAKILHKPGKLETKGDMVQDMYDAGRLEDIHSYCRCDVLDTYFVFLRIMLLRGYITEDREKELVEMTKNWLRQNAESVPIYQQYLDMMDN